MIEILVLLIVIPGIAALAKGRGGSPWVAGSLALGGLLALRTVFGLLPFDSDVLIGGLLLSYAWVGGVAAYYRFVVGAGRPKPTGIWLCPNCTYTNKAYVLACGACQSPWQPPAE